MADDEPAGFYPWGGDIRLGNPASPVAVVTLAEDFHFDADRVAVWGHLKTENLGIEKIVANVISNPAIRVLVLCGREIRGHRSGDALRALHANGMDGDGKIKGSRGAVPFIENLGPDAIARFRAQVVLVDLLDVVDESVIQRAVSDQLAKGWASFGEPFIVKHTSGRKAASGPNLDAGVALHGTLGVDLYGEIGPLAAQSDMAVHKSIRMDLYGTVEAV